MKSIPKYMTRFIAALPRRHQVLLSSVCAVTLLVVLLPSESATASKHVIEPQLGQSELILGQRYQLQIDVEKLKTDASSQPDTTVQWSGYEVRSGDSLARIFDKMGFTPQQLYRVTQDSQADKLLRKIHPGDTLRFAKDENDDLIQIAYQINPTDTLIVSKSDNGFVSEIESKTVEVRTETAHARITSSFWNAGIDAGLTEGQIMSIADIFGWDIDFALDLREGDEFSVMFEKEYADGEFVGYGRVLAAEFVNRGEHYQAFLHDNGDFYTAEGRAMRKSFLRSPVKFTYISSSFNPRRLHPVTGKVRPHNGIDYAAQTGTPVMSSGAGKVIASAYNNLNGHYVFVQHGERYVTKYLHLSKRLVKKGQRVKQGELIGRVGATGRVTGAHLHYEFLVDGVHRNPRTVKFPQAESLIAAELPVFKEIAQQRLAVLNDSKRLYLAMR
ncbi:peptidase M23 [Pseudidiomarina tainanensis]|jgi:murein DD-endopeptidase MepM/ murein hydrolase activator NlpD|uniref:Peptidase M23 n=1 Tax=Pseudidiomarina tainanensis TaxID=502365 RepID=A0ACD2HHG5_9GAMM|nr:peptidoglycan DD-metalloendopeptidase family protein [Pseudidiomarina tainanensis]RZQ55275.1 peptidase M23 [Pseudidiomarina tainanensis]